MKLPIIMFPAVTSSHLGSNIPLRHAQSVFLYERPSFTPVQDHSQIVLVYVLIVTCIDSIWEGHDRDGEPCSSFSTLEPFLLY
jgi:hypothetical protein